MAKRACVECPICINRIAPTRRVTCPFCEYTCCRTCAETYITGSLDDPSCMNPDCRRRFDHEVLLNIFPATFVNTTLKRHRENVLFDRERSMLAATMPYVEAEKQRRLAQTEADQIVAERARLRNQLNELNRRLWHLQRTVHRANPDNLEPGGASERREFVQQCPQAGCRGWLSSAHKCSLCERFSCAHCMAPLGRTRDENAAHVCVPSDVASVAAIKNDSTPCPTCGVRVTKVSGCMAMWCTQCHTSFDYRSGRKINGVVHNPHYFEWMRTREVAGRQPGDVPCGGCPELGEISRVARDVRATDGELRTLYASVRLVRHIEQVEMPRYMPPDREQQNRSLRVRFMLHDLSETEFKQRVQRLEKHESKARDVCLVLEMLQNTMADELRQFAVKEKTSASAVANIHGLVEYANTSLRSISVRYKQVTPRVHQDTFTMFTWGDK